MKNEKVLSKSGRSLVKHGYWKTKDSEGIWDNGKQIGKHIYYIKGIQVQSIQVFDKLGRVIISIIYNFAWNGDPLKNVNRVSVREYENDKDRYGIMGWDLEWPAGSEEAPQYRNLELVEEILDANKEILMGCISAL